jgi:invasion protein IalB
MMSQTLSSRKLKKIVSVLAIGKDKSGKLMASIRLPVGVSLPQGVAVGFEHQKQFSIPYSACHRIGCFAAFDLTEPMVGQMQKAASISAVAQSVSRQALNLNFSTRGFPLAYETYLRESR